MGTKKKLIISMVVALVVCTLLAISFNLDGEGSSSSSSKSVLSDDPDVIMANAEKESANATEDKMRDFNVINIDKYFELLPESTYSLVLFERPGCYYCQIAEPILKTILYENEGLEINSINTDDLSGNDKERLYDSDEFFTNLGTPLLLVIGDNKIIDNIDGMTDRAHYEELLKKYKFIK